MQPFAKGIYSYPNNTTPEMLKPNGYTQHLLEFTNEKCNEMAPSHAHECVAAFVQPFDCIIRSRVSKNGDTHDNYGYCSGSIENGINTILKINLPKSEMDVIISKFKTTCKELSNAKKPFC